MYDLRLIKKYIIMIINKVAFFLPTINNPFKSAQSSPLTKGFDANDCSRARSISLFLLL